MKGVPNSTNVFERNSNLASAVIVRKYARRRCLRVKTVDGADFSQTTIETTANASEQTRCTRI